MLRGLLGAELWAWILSTGRVQRTAPMELLWVVLLLSSVFSTTVRSAGGGGGANSGGNKVFRVQTSSHSWFVTENEEKRRFPAKEGIQCNKVLIANKQAQISIWLNVTPHHWAKVVSYLTHRRQQENGINLTKIFIKENNTFMRFQNTLHLHGGVLTPVEQRTQENKWNDYWKEHTAIENPKYAWNIC